MKYLNISIIAILILLLNGCTRKSPDSEVPKVPNEHSISEVRVQAYDSTYLSMDSLYNAYFKDEDYGWIKLTNGIYNYVGPDSNEYDRGYVSISKSFTFADLDGDGYKDAIGSIATNTGGSGVYISMDIFLNRHRRAIHTASYHIGDREGIDSIKVMNDTICLYRMKRASGEPMASASLQELKMFKYSKNKLIEIN